MKKNIAVIRTMNVFKSIGASIKLYNSLVKKHIDEGNRVFSKSEDDLSTIFEDGTVIEVVNLENMPSNLKEYKYIYVDESINKHFKLFKNTKTYNFKGEVVE